MIVVKKTFGKMTKCISRDTGRPYKDWHAMFLGFSGLILIMQSEKKLPGKVFIYFYPYDDGWDPKSYIHTAYGDLEISDDGCELCTDDSVFEFEFGDQELPEKALQEYYEVSKRIGE